MRAATYTRISSEIQADGHSLDAQLAACLHLCQERGWAVVAQYTDVESARTTERPQFRAMLTSAEAHAFDVIVVHKLDRFSRSVTDMLFTLRRLSALNVGLVSISEQFDFSTAIGKVLLTMLSAFAEWYLDNLSAETKKGKCARAEKGQWNGVVPFGYAIQYKKDGGNGVPFPDPQTGPGVLLAFETYASGGYSDADIAHLLNDHNYRPRVHGPRTLPVWSPQSVRGMLMNPFYAGAVLYHGHRHEGQHEPIINADLFDRCQEARHRRASRLGITARHDSHVYLLSGLARCARCGRPMHGLTGDPRRPVHRWYRDSARHQGAQCTQRLVRADDAEQTLSDWIAGIHLPEDWQAQVLSLVEKTATRIDDRQQQVQRIERELAKLKELFVMTDLTTGEYEARRDQLKAQLPSAQPAKLPDLQRAAQLLQHFGEIWAGATNNERQHLLSVLLDAVYLDYERGPVVTIQPKADLYALFQLPHAVLTFDNLACANITVLHSGATPVAPESSVSLSIPLASSAPPGSVPPTPSEPPVRLPEVPRR